ncbi:putative F-box protein [Camellia lanceoleosa]|uniref:F-box protein n=2 Tax=Camellia lanceoleosa TaxID=1840588 RepID=A0ACC0FEH8_9ERIC|nr:putative F-box protein [Camellia lanceoleosa]KAI7987132.1 putative F-box protein [Camellia lanceoleosa]
MRATRDTQLRESSKQYKLPQKDKLSRLSRASANEKKEHMNGLPEIKWSQVAHLPYDLIFKILLLLPAESLHRSSFVCKAWFNLVNSSNFTDAYICHSETVFIFLQLVSQRRPKTFSIEAKLGLSEYHSIFLTREPSRSYINFLVVKDGKSKVIESQISGLKDILATCNGLILATCEQNGGLLVINPVTRKLVALPLGTINARDESYGFVFGRLTGEYKVVHLFRDESGYISCEILSLATRSWWAVDGPSFGLFTKLIRKPVAAIGALHWLPAKHGCSYIVSLSIDDGKFHTRALPISSSVNDRLLEIGGFLSFVTHVTLNRIEVWILKGLQGGSWIKRHIITSNKITDLIPISTLRHGREMVFKGCRDGSFYAYDIEIQVMRKVEMEGEPHRHRSSYLPHVNTLASWESNAALW